MPAYKYKLQKLLDLRISIEDEKKNEFGLAVKRLEDEKRKLAEIYRNLEEMRLAFENRSSEGVSAAQLQQMNQYMDYYRKSIKKQNTKIKMAEKYLDECRTALIKASQEKKMIEKLKEMDHIKYLYEEQKKEDKLVDDLVSYRENNKQ